MGLLTTCPPGAAMASLLSEACGTDIGQVQKILFQRQFASSGVRNSMTVAQAALKTNWDTRLGAAGNTKVQVSPFIHAPETEPGGPIKYGGGNDTRDGIQIITGIDPTGFTARFLKEQFKVIKRLKQLFGEELGVYYIDQHGRLVCDSDNTENPTVVYPIPIREYFVGDRDFGGFGEPNSNHLEWYHAPNWSDDLTVIVPSDFDALTSLVNP
jgi:hypothetical protein